MPDCVLLGWRGWDLYRCGRGRVVRIASSPVTWQPVMMAFCGTGLPGRAGVVTAGGRLHALARCECAVPGATTNVLRYMRILFRRGGSGRLCLLGADDLPGRADHVPVPAVVVLALAGRVTGRCIAKVGVQRPSVIGDDAAAARIRRRPQ